MEEEERRTPSTVKVLSWAFLFVPILHVSFAYLLVGGCNATAPPAMHMWQACGIPCSHGMQWTTARILQHVKRSVRLPNSSSNGL